MAVFAYKARDSRGAEVRGTLHADNRQAALAQLDQKALLPVDVQESAATGAAGGRVGLAQLSQFYSQLADLLQAGVPILRSLDTLGKQRGRSAFIVVVQNLRDSVAGGEALAESMAKHPYAFPQLHVAMIAAGEKGGFVEDVLINLAQFVEKQDELRGKVIASMIYPSVLLVAGIAICIAVVVWFVPKFEPMLANYPNKMFLTVMVFAISNLLRAHALEVGVTVGVLGLVLLGVMRSPAARAWIDRWSLKMPVLGPVLTMVCLCRFCRILGTLLKNGIPILQSLKIAQESAGNAVLAEQIEIATESVRKGDTLAGPLAVSGMFPPEIIDMIAVGEESNQLDTVLVKIATSQEARTARKVDAAVKLLEPAILILIAGMVAVVAIALLVPIMTSSSMVH